jgi:anti-sigma factor RsiW
MNCEKTRRVLDAYLDGELELSRELDLEAHLAACSTCKNAAEEIFNLSPLERAGLPLFKHLHS